ncbi:MAG: hypothetical protein IKH88_06015 [Prevotella sp.]|nr:hypothetical protein [Prevotella sp.]
MKTIVANINATNIRVGGFCDEYSNLHDELQIKVNEQYQEVLIVNTEFSDHSLHVFGASETKARILSLPEAYNDYEVLLHGLENATTHEIHIKCIMKAVRLDDPINSQNAGLCLLGPVRYLPYRVTIIFADTRKAWDLDIADPDYWDNTYGEAYVFGEFRTEQEREEFIQSYANDIDESVGDRVIRF